MYAAKASSGDSIDELVGRGAQVNAQDWDRDMPIHIAARQGSESAVRALLAHGSDVDRRGSDRKTPLEIAVDNDDWAVANDLVSANACVTEAMKEHAAKKKQEKLLAVLEGGSRRGCRH
jgi:ankyrin repeat protein